MVSVSNIKKMIFSKFVENFRSHTWGNCIKMGYSVPLNHQTLQFFLKNLWNKLPRKSRHGRNWIQCKFETNQCQFSIFVTIKWIFRYAKKLCNLANNFHKKGRELLYNYDPNEFNVINHGDFWINNILFKYDNEGTPIKAIFVNMNNITS